MLRFLVDGVYFVLVIGVVLAWPFRVLLRKLKGKTAKIRAPWRARMSAFPPVTGDQRALWVHGVSVGEVLSARALITTFCERHPGVPVVVTTTTPAGLKCAQSVFPEHLVSYSPLDFSWVVARAFRAFRPRMIILCELDLWPNQLLRAKGQGVPVVVASGRCSERSARGYRRLRRVFPGVFAALRVVAAQNERERRRWLSIGLSSDRVVVAGSLKVDNLPPVADPSEVALFRANFGFGDHRIWVAGSTHPGEEEIILAAHRRLLEIDPSFRLALAPRHVERAPKIDAMATKLGLTVARSRAMAQADAEVLLVDEMGRLEELFAIAEFVFLGGSLAPIGGHNLLEPAARARMILVGPELDSVREMAEELAGLGALQVVRDEDELFEAVARGMRDRDETMEKGRIARAWVDARANAAEKTIEAFASQWEGS